MKSNEMHKNMMCIKFCEEICNLHQYTLIDLVRYINICTMSMYIAYILYHVHNNVHGQRTRTVQYFGKCKQEKVK